jgi:tRNA 2-thiouridine synthesizing protein A
MTRAQRAQPAGSPVTAARAPAPGGQRPVLTLDALGKKCPIPIIMLADRIRDVQIGQLIEVLADDPAAKTDLPAWCTLKSQEFVGARELPAVGDPLGETRPRWSFLVRRSY